MVSVLVARLFFVRHLRGDRILLREERGDHRLPILVATILA